MKISFQKLALPEKDTVVLGVLAGSKMLPLTRDMDRAVKGLLKQAMADSTFNGGAHETLAVATPRGPVLLYGLGDGKEIDAGWAEKAGGSIYAALAKSGAKIAHVVFEAHKGGEEGWRHAPPILVWP